MRERRRTRRDEVRAAMQISVFGFLGDGAGRSPVDEYVEELARTRDEGFSRMWTAQLPYEPDLLLTLAVALREVSSFQLDLSVLGSAPSRP
jgi:5,10-methylenetetrahydromethanopterin reductase